MEENICLHAIIEGHVQGVSFRYFVLRRADALGISGWVRNTYQGQVEVMAEGNRLKLENLLSHLRIGPPSSFVSEVKPTWGKASGNYKKFSVARTV
jgi:acylphosphatase